MSSWWRSFAKINLHLQVEGRRPDGYHQLTTLFQTVSLHDLVSLEVREERGIELSVPDGGAPTDESNLAHQAARALLDAAPSDKGLRIVLRKRIPAGGGLGGGSANAATVLVAGNQALGLELSPERLRSLAADLGADVPYFLVGGTALGRGRGDEIEPLSEIPATELLLVDPGVSVGTAEVFRALDVQLQRPLPPAIQAFVAGGPAPAGIEGLGGFNDLEAPVLAGFPEVRSVYNALRRAGASLVRISGSGATVFAHFAGPQRASEAPAHLPSGARAYTTRTLSRSEVKTARSIGVDEGEWL